MNHGRKYMPLTEKGQKILSHMEKEYGSPEKAKQVLYAGENKGTFTGIHDDSEEPATQEAMQEPDYKPVTSLSLADIQKKNREFWGVGQQEGTAQETPAHQAEKVENLKKLP
jgi:hypothetical protein